jgi:HEAT repeat protein
VVLCVQEDGLGRSSETAVTKRQSLIRGSGSRVNLSLENLVEQFVIADPAQAAVLESQLLAYGHTAVPALLSALATHDSTWGSSEPSRRIAHLLTTIGSPATSDLVMVLQHADRPLWDTVVRILARIGTADAITAVFEAVRTTSEDDQLRFLDANGELIEAEDDEDPDHISMQGSSWELLETTLVDHAEAVIPYAIDQLHNPDARVRHLAVSVLTWVGEHHGSAQVVDALLFALQDMHPNVRTAAAYGLQAQGFDLPQHEQALPALIAALDDPHPDVRYLAVGTLGAFVEAHVATLLLSIAQKSQEAPAVRDAAQRIGLELQAELQSP